MSTRMVSRYMEGMDRLMGGWVDGLVGGEQVVWGMNGIDRPI